MASSENKKKRFVISQRRVCGAHKMAVGVNDLLCAFCNTRLTVLSNNTLGCFNCNCRYFDYTDKIHELITDNEDITLTDIAEKLNVDIQYLSEYVMLNGFELGKGDARICQVCGHVVLDGGECKYCSLREMKKVSDNKAKLSEKKETVKTGSKRSAMHYIGQRSPHVK